MKSFKKFKEKKIKKKKFQRSFFKKYIIFIRQFLLNT